MNAQRSFGFLVLSTMAALAACGDTADVSEFSYGKGQPGLGLPEGGEIRHENVRILGLPEQTWMMVYQYTGPTLAQTSAFAVPAEGGHGKWGNCVDERNAVTGTPDWPLSKITGATYLDLPKVELTGPGITGTLNITKSTPVNTSGNSTLRSYGFTYGGGAPGNPPAGFNGTLTAAMSMAGGKYTLDIGKKDIDGKVTPMDFWVPEAYTAPLGIGGGSMIMIPAGKDLTYTWTTPKNDKGTSGKEHTKKTYFNLTFFADPAGIGAQFLCFPDTDGHQTVPAAVIDALTPGGLMVNANLTHWQDAREAAPGEMRRFDLVSIYCNISAYSKQ
jgi:hypothetical protein